MSIDSTKDEDVVRTFIWGSCVSRDTFEFLPEKYRLTTYVARQSLISAGNDTSHVRSKLTPLTSAFQQRMVRGDLAGDLFRRVEAVGSDIDLFLIDLVDERAGVVDFGEGKFATRLSEFWGSGGKELAKGARTVPFGTDEHFRLWSFGAQQLAGALERMGLLERSLVVYARWADRFDTGEPLDVPAWMMPPAEANSAFTRYYGVLRELGLPIAELPEVLARTSDSHRWQASPFHYQDDAYRYLADAIRGRLTPPTQG